MKKLVLVLAVGVLFSALISYTSPALAAPAFEDPQICLNGKLLMIEPTSQPIEVWVGVGPGVTTSLDVTSCGGDPNLPVLATDHLLHNGLGNWVEVVVKTKKHTDVLFHWDGATVTRNSGNDKFITVIKRVN
jgi:hypothetical protein